MAAIEEERILREFRDEIEKTIKKCAQPFNDKFLLKFIRANDYCVKRSLQQLNRYQRTRDQNSDLFHFGNELKVVYESGALTVLEKRGSNGELILISRPGLMNPSLYSLRKLIQATCVAIEVETDDECTQRNGVINIVDFGGFGLKQMFFCGPLQAKLFANLIDGILPVKFKAIHLVNESRIAEIGFNLVKSFLGENFRTKLHFHGNRLEQLQNFVEKSVLPVEIGGENKALSGLEYFEKIEFHVNRVA